MSPPLSTALSAGLALVCAACFSPAFEDGAIECGEAGCPDGMYCGTDGYCHDSGDSGDDGAGRDELALAVANDDGTQLFAMCDGQPRLVWSTRGTARHLAWGDTDGDGVAELAVANINGPAAIYELVATGFERRWTSPESRGSRAIELADFDGDGADDLLLGLDDGPLQLYSTGGGELSLSWTNGVDRANWALSAADYDADGDPDFAVAIKQQADEVFRNDGGTPNLVWTTAAVEQSESLQWADVDGDGWLDLATGAEQGQARIYRHTGTDFELLWESPVVEDTEAVAFADYDGDGLVDLSVGNWLQPARIYRNEGSSFTSVWTYGIAADDGAGIQVETMAWTDYDGDGDNDLLIGRHQGRNVLLRNEGDGLLIEVWRSDDRAATRLAAWYRWQRPDGFAPLCDW